MKEFLIFVSSIFGKLFSNVDAAAEEEATTTSAIAAVSDRMLFGFMA